VGLGRIELPTSPLSGVRSSQLSYRPKGFLSWWSWSGSNRRPPECKSGALPAELQPLFEESGARSQEPESSASSDHSDSCLLTPDSLSSRGQLDAETMSPAHGLSDKLLELPSGDTGRAHRPGRSPADGLEWNGCSLLILPMYTPSGADFESSTHVLS
jgi:hypothetical protein